MAMIWPFADMRHETHLLVYEAEMKNGQVVHGNIILNTPRLSRAVLSNALSDITHNPMFKSNAVIVRNVIELK